MEHKRGRGRPRSTDPLFQMPIRLNQAMLAQIDACKVWLQNEQNDPSVSRAHAIRYLIERGIASMDDTLYARGR